MDTQDVLYGGSIISVKSESVMIGEEADLGSLTDYPPGTIAYTAGFKAMWQLSANGVWVDMLGDEDDA